jgi:hypothetical protein
MLLDDDYSCALTSDNAHLHYIQHVFTRRLESYGSHVPSSQSCTYVCVLTVRRCSVMHIYYIAQKKRTTAAMFILAGILLHHNVISKGTS